MDGGLQRGRPPYGQGGPEGPQEGMEGVQGPAVQLLLQRHRVRGGRGQRRRGHRRGVHREARGRLHPRRRQPAGQPRELQHRSLLGYGAVRGRGEARGPHVGQRLRRGRGVRCREAGLRQGVQQRQHRRRGGQGPLPVRQEGVLCEARREAAAGDIPLQGAVQQACQDDVVQREGASQEVLRGRRPRSGLLRDPPRLHHLSRAGSEEGPPRQGHRGPCEERPRGGGGRVVEHVRFHRPSAEEPGRHRRMEGRHGEPVSARTDAGERVQEGVRCGDDHSRGKGPGHGPRDVRPPVRDGAAGEERA